MNLLNNETNRVEKMIIRDALLKIRLSEMLNRTGELRNRENGIY